MFFEPLFAVLVVFVVLDRFSEFNLPFYPFWDFQTVWAIVGQSWAIVGNREQSWVIMGYLGAIVGTCGEIVGSRKDAENGQRK